MKAIRFLPSQASVQIEEGATIWDAARQAGLLLETPCNGAGTCGKCRVRVVSGETEARPSEHRLSRVELENGWRLACETVVTDSLEVEIFPQSQTKASHVILTDGDSFEVERDEYASGIYGVAFDLGTTTVAGSLYDLSTGQECAVRATLNRQTVYGDDVISRIGAVRAQFNNLVQLQRLAVETFNEVIEALCAATGRSPTDIRRVTVAGNTTMQQLLLAIDPSPLGEKPFTPAFFDAQIVVANTLGLNTHPDAPVIVFPQIGGFVGGDTVAGLLAANADTFDKPTLLVDIGTNGEIALFNKGAILTASTAAGPAFEGARIRQGMRAVTGAIDQVWIAQDDLSCHVIGGHSPKGLCGSALIDVIALLLQVGLLNETGLLEVVEANVTPLSDQLKSRLIETEQGTCFVLAFKPDGSPLVVLTQQDVRELQLASGALRSGIDTLLKKAGLTTMDLDAILLAGGFGNYIRCAHAIAIGLLPLIPIERIRFVGNASLTGAKRVLLSKTEQVRAQGIQKRAEHVELASEPGFTNAFMDAMMLGARS
ncbi:MAG: ASKHA domain-containing protein [bacterium]